MPVKIHRPPAETAARIEEAIRGALDDVDVSVSGMGGHFEIRVASRAFEGKSTLERQRLVYRAIAHLMQGEGAPVHAVDRLETVVPAG